MLVRWVLFLLIFWTLCAVSDVVIKSQVSVDYVRNNVTFERPLSVQSADRIKTDHSDTYYSSSTPFDDSDTSFPPRGGYSLPEIVVNWAFDVLYSIDYKTVFLLTISVAGNGNKEVDFIPVQKQTLMLFGAVSLQFLRGGQSLFNQLDNSWNEIVVFPFSHETAAPNPDVAVTGSSSEITSSGAAGSGEERSAFGGYEQRDDGDGRDEEHSENHEGCSICERQICLLCPCDRCTIDQMVNEKDEAGAVALSQLMRAVRNVLEGDDSAVQCRYEDGAVECEYSDSASEDLPEDITGSVGRKRTIKSKYSGVLNKLSEVQDLVDNNDFDSARVTLREIIKEVPRIQFKSLLRILGPAWGKSKLRELVGIDYVRKKIKMPLQKVMTEIEDGQYEKAKALLIAIVQSYDEEDYTTVVDHFNQNNIPVLSQAGVKSGSVSWNVRFIYELMGQVSHTDRTNSGISLIDIREAVENNRIIQAWETLRIYLNERKDKPKKETAGILKSAGVPVIINGQLVEGAIWNIPSVVRAYGEEYSGNYQCDRPSEIKKAFDAGDMEVADLKLIRYLSGRPKHEKGITGTVAALNLAGVPVYIAGDLIEDARWSNKFVRAAMGTDTVGQHAITPRMIKDAIRQSNLSLAKRRLKKWLDQKERDCDASKVLNRSKVPVLTDGSQQRWSSGLVRDARSILAPEELTDLSQSSSHSTESSDFQKAMNPKDRIGGNKRKIASVDNPDDEIQSGQKRRKRK